MVNARRVFATAGVLGKALRGRRGARVRRARGEERSWGSTDAACAQHSKCGWQQAAAAERDGGGGEVGGAMERRRGREGER